jgi:Zn-dependent peptidase ImmA (M78 family)
MPNFKRGFKTWAENIAGSIRQDLKIKKHEPLPATALAEYLKIELLRPEDVKDIPPHCLKQLLEIDSDGWSATTFHVGDRSVIIYNPQHSKKRQASDLMHEFAHILCGHKLAQIILSADGKIVMRTFDQQQEDEAGWLSGCLLLPRDALFHIKRTRLTNEEASTYYQVSNDMVNYRLNVSGVKYLLQNIKNSKFSRA